jgi:PAS domain S-box-containing protein
MHINAAQAPEIDGLRRITRDLVALSTLPAVWSGLAPDGLIKSLSSVLLTMLDLDLVYLQLFDGGDSTAIDIVRSKQPAAEAQFLPPLRALFDGAAGRSSVHAPATLVHPLDERQLRVSAIRLGIGDETGILLVGSARPDFPSEHERLLLGVSANQAAVVLQRHAAEQALKRSEKHFTDLADAAPAIFWVTDPDGNCTFLSRGWYEFTGQRDEDGLGFGWIDAIHPEDRDAASTAFLAANANAEEFSLEHRILHVDGSYRWVIDSGRPRFSAAGRFLGFVGNVLDITDRKQMEQTQRALFDEVAKSHKNLSEFLAVLAHELRNPLAPILTGLEIMRMRADHPETVANVRGIIERQVKQLSHLINDLLDIARVTNGKVDIKKDTIDLKSIVSNAVETSLPLMEKGGHAFSLELPPAPLPVNADAARIAQVIGNLLTNAAKYTAHGGKIRLTVERDGDAAVVSVIDNGIGIPAESLDSVFDMFSQVGRNMNYAQGGLGIGLSLVRQLLSLHDGTVEARSEGVGKGSSFVVRLPIDVASVPVHLDAAPGAPAQAGKSLRILVTDDNVDAAKTLASLLEMYGHELRIAHGGQQALRIAEQFRPDVAFLDIGMPDMTGYEVARRLREMPGLERCVIAAVSGWGAKDDLARSTDAGIDMHFTKPVAPARVSEFLSRLQ